ncbi:aldehyde dehydrogenase family protein [Hirschia maritima]|uniref:aldehyde dehydrogenase family protein n=1 Tax=Hirschia maritima TaxID=1121961 RepID=UPI0003817191|nr:aldehyde dehydrogenase family protein [Hirschia maritima]
MSNTLQVRNPRTGEYDYSIQSASEEVIASVASKLRQSQSNWAQLALSERADALKIFAELLIANKVDIAAALEKDTGRRKIAALEVDAVAGSIMAWLGQVESLLPKGWTKGISNPALQHAPQFIPYQLVGVISPWNFPMVLSMIDTVPALLAGCSVMIKPSEVTPRFADVLSKVIDDSPLKNVLSFVQGNGMTGASLIKNVDAVCFTGSVATGRKVAMAAAEQMIPAFLELGGKDPLIVLSGSNLEHATDAALRGATLSTGQACQSIERVYVQNDILAEFTNLLTQKAKQTRLNWPEITQGEIGPIIFDKQATILQDHIDDAVAKGAEILAGGKIENHGGGLWLEPTVISNVDHSMKVMTDETFGPIIPVMGFETAQDAIKFANDTEYGLSGAVFASDLKEAQRVGVHIEAGAISLNDAALTSLFHEAEKHSFKLSGMGGSRMGTVGFQRFLRRKALIANTGAPAPISAFSED